MALRIIDGVPGAGKTFFAVDHALKTFFKWDDETDTWLPKEHDTVLITNIDSLKIGVQLEDELSEVGGDVEAYFNYEYLEKKFDGRKVVYILDEAQGIFHYKFFSKSVFLFFQKHRHLGMDVYLVTQDVGHLAKGLRNLAEYHISAVKRTMSLMGEFRYKFSDPVTGGVWKTKVLRRDGRVFSVYRSMLAGETEKLASVPRKFLILFSVGVVLLGFLFFSWVKWRFNKRAATAEAAAAELSTKQKGQGSGASRVPIVKPGSIVSEKFPRVAAEIIPPGRPGVLTGSADFGGGVVYLVAIEGRSFRLSEEQLTRACRCHPEFLVEGQPFEAWLYTGEGPKAGAPVAHAVGTGLLGERRVQ